MAREYIAVVKDDLTGKTLKEEEVHSFTFGWQGKQYSIDLGPQTAEEFLNVMDKYVNVATVAESRFTPTPARRGRPATASSSDRAARKEELSAIRTWWREQGNEIGDRGRIPQDIVDAYHAANPA